jgi:hypothetical protein
MTRSSVFSPLQSQALWKRLRTEPRFVVYVGRRVLFGEDSPQDLLFLRVVEDRFLECVYVFEQSSKALCNKRTGFTSSAMSSLSITYWMSGSSSVSAVVDILERLQEGKQANVLSLVQTAWVLRTRVHACILLLYYSLTVSYESNHISEGHVRSSR